MEWFLSILIGIGTGIITGWITSWRVTKYYRKKDEEKEKSDIFKKAVFEMQNFCIKICYALSKKNKDIINLIPVIFQLFYFLLNMNKFQIFN